MGKESRGLNRGNSNQVDTLKSYLRHWFWFGLSAVIFIGLAKVYLRYAVPEYGVNAKIQILESKSGSSELSVLQDLNIFAGGNTEIKDEIEVLGSRGNFIQVVRELGLNVNLMLLGNIKNSELYEDDYPFNINFLAPDSVLYNSKYTFFITPKSETTFEFREEEEGPSKLHSFGASIATEIGEVVLVPKSNLIEFFFDKDLKISVNPLFEVADFYRKKTNITTPDKLSKILDLSLTDPIKQRGVDVVNTLIRVNNENEVADNKAVADQTTKFINDRIAEIYSNLSAVDDTAEEFKSSRGISDLGNQANVNISASTAGEQQLQNANVQLSIANQMRDYISDQEQFEIIPPNVGLNDPNVASSVQRYNQLLAERRRLLKSSNEKNPVIVELDQQLESLRQGIQTSLDNVTDNLNLQVNSLSNQLSRIRSRIYAAPGNERALRDIARRQQTTESLYLYLLQKSEEAQITFASTPPKSKVIDTAYGSKFPVEPQPIKIYLAALILGLGLPFSVIYLRDLLNNKVENKLTLEGLIDDVPVLAELPRLKKKEKTLVTNEDRSVLAESLRILRTNLDYSLKARKRTGGGSFIFVTSSVPGEGKTFVASNLAMIYAKTGKKVLLIGGDIRNPKINQFYSGRNVDKLKRVSGNKDNKGLTDYIVEHSLTARDITNTMLVSDQTIDIIHSGKLMPNPAELLMSDRLEEIVNEVRMRYDYIIVDTAPMVVVSDTLLISRFADIVLYVTRAHYTDLKVLNFPLKMKDEGKIENLNFVVNAVKDTNLGYGGKYGYGYGRERKKWWKFA